MMTAMLGAYILGSRKQAALLEEPGTYGPIGATEERHKYSSKLPAIMGP